MPNITLPTALRRALLHVPGPTAVAMTVNRAPAVVIKAGADDAKSMNKRGIVIAVSPQLGLYDAGAVFRLYIEFRDKAQRPMSLDTFLNPAQEHDLALLRQLTISQTLDFYLFDMDLNHVGQKRIRWNERTGSDIQNMIRQAHQHNASLPRTNYAAALEQMQRENPV